MEKKEDDKVREERNHGAIRKIIPPKIETEEIFEIPDDIPSFPAHPPPKSPSMENLYVSSPSVSEEDNSSKTLDGIAGRDETIQNTAKDDEAKKGNLDNSANEILLKKINGFDEVCNNKETKRETETSAKERNANFAEPLNANELKIDKSLLTLTLTSQGGAHSKTKVAALKKRFEDKMNSSAGKSNDAAAEDEDDDDENEPSKPVTPGKTFYDLSTEQKKFFNTPKLDAGEVKPSEEVLDVQNPDSDKSIPKGCSLSLNRRESFEKAKRIFENNF